jgi:hypothetical protein
VSNGLWALDQPVLLHARLGKGPAENTGQQCTSPSCILAGSSQGRQGYPGAV